MNERIKELAEQAYEYSDIPNTDGVFNKEKFAELIVNECVRIAELKEQGHSEYSGDVSVGWYIKNHFGVTE